MDDVAVIGWHEGSAGQVHSWFEQAGLGRIVCFIHPDDEFPQIENIPRAVLKFSYPAEGQFKGLPLYCQNNWPDLLAAQGINKALVSISDSEQRWKEIQKARQAGLQLINAIHPSTVFLPECSLGENVIIHANCLVGYRAEVDDGVILNTGSQIDHHCKIKRAVTIDPGVVLAGNVLVEEFCSIHTRAAVINKIRIGRNSVVGAGTVVIRDIEANSVVVGVPGRKIKSRPEPFISYV